MQLFKAIVAGLVLTSLSTSFAFGQFSETKPLRLKAEYNVEEGSRKGKLVLTATIADGYYMYSLTQGKVPPPTKLTVTDSKAYKLMGKFTPDTKPKVAFDDIFKSNIEKHFKTVIFTAPIEITEGVDAKALKIVISLKGQVCDDNSCTRYKGEKTTASFSGFVKKTEKKKQAK